LSKPARAWVDFDGATKMVEGMILLVQCAVGSAQVGVGHRVIRSKCQGRSERTGGVRGSAHGLQGQAEVVVNAWVVEPHGERFPTAAGGPIEFAKCPIRLPQRGAKDRHFGS